MKTSRIAVVLIALTAPASLAQELSVEERMCITSAVTKLPPVAVSSIDGSRVTERRAVEQPQSQGRRNQYPVNRIRLEIDVTVAGQKSTYLFNCIQSGQSTLVQPLGMR